MPGAAALLLALIALKAIALAVDPTIRLYLGDSAAYLAGALSDTWLPRDRSFTYSLLLRALVRPAGSLWALLLWQALAGIGVALLLWVTLVRRLAVPRVPAGIIACALAVEPAQLYYERMVMAETLGLLSFAGFFAASSAYLASGRLLWLPAAATAGLAAASLRLNYLPAAVAIALVLPALRLLDESQRLRWRPLVLHLIVAICSVGALHTTYRHAVGSIFGVPPSYLARGGVMQLGLVAPLVKPEHFIRLGLPPDFDRRLKYELADPATRTLQLWQSGGLVDAIARQQLDVEQTARALAGMAMADDPLGVLRLGIATVGDYFRPHMARAALDNDLGRRAYPEALLKSLRDDWEYDASGVAFRVTPIARYFELGSWWLVACLCLMLPLAILSVIATWRTPQRSQVLLAALAGAGLVLTHVIFVNIAFYRYLHALPFFFLAMALILITTVYRRPGSPSAAQSRRTQCDRQRSPQGR